MTAQGTRARIASNNVMRLFAVSQVRLERSGHIADVWWVEVDSSTNANVGEPMKAPVADVVDAIHAGHGVVARFSSDHDAATDRHFVVREHADGHETIQLEPARTAEHATSDSN